MSHPPSSPASSTPSPDLSRRALLGRAALGAALGGLAAAGALPAASEGPGAAPAPAPAPKPTSPAAPAARRMPVAFVGHGSPMTALDPARGGEWQRWGEGWGRPTAVLAVSAHWEAAPATLSAPRPLPLIYDFYGFPRELYQVTYAAPGAPRLAARVQGLLAPLGGARASETRGLDHGAWAPLVWLQRAADVPVLQLSLPTQDGPALVRLGQALAPLRDEGVVILASGNLTHNLRAVGRMDQPPPAWAQEHDAWLADVLARRDLDALADFRRKAPALRQNHPTLEHLTPLMVAAGAAARDWSRSTFPVTGWDGSLSRRCVELG